MVDVIWIPIEEELPGSSDIPVLFWISEDVPDNKRGIYVGFYSDRIYDNHQGRWFDIWGRNVYQGVTHWAALPAGPEGTLYLIGMELPDWILV